MKNCLSIIKDAMSRNKKDEKDINLIKGGRSFYYTLFICLTVFMLAIALLIVAFNRLISRHDQHLSGEICTIMSEKMNSSIDFMTQSTQSMASVLSAQTFSSPDEIYETLKGYKKADYLSIGFIDAYGSLYATAEEEAEFNKWHLLDTARKADPVSMSAPYRSSVYGLPVITMFSVFEYGGGLRGYMFTTYMLKKLQEVAVTQSLGDDIEIWLMDAGSANIIQCAGADEHATGSWTNAYLTMQNVNKEDRPIYNEWLNRATSLEDNIGISYSIGNTIYSQHCSVISSMPGWYVVVRIPSKALSATMNTFRNYVLVFLSVLLIAVIVLITNMYRLSQRDNEVLNSLSIHDPLTGAFNRRAFDLAAEKWLSRGHDCALIFFDIDYFKQVNDRFGHDAGDRLLVAFCDILKANFSEDGIISRFGGDEFVVLTNTDTVDSVSEWLKKTTDDVHALNIDGEKNDSDDFMFSFSAGAARFPQDADNLSALKKCADTALYETKEKGRNGYLWFADVFTGSEPEEIITVTDIAEDPLEQTDTDTKPDDMLIKDKLPQQEQNSSTKAVILREEKTGTKKVVRKVIRKKIVKKVVKKAPSDD